jgi:hypothetical protein
MNNQKTETKIGVWMDHSVARLISVNTNPVVIREIQSSIQPRLRIEGESGDGTKLGGVQFGSNNEHSKNEKKQNELQQYYKELSAAIRDYEEILIFGPTMAQNEFVNFISKDKHFKTKKIDTYREDYLTENQILEFVRNKISKH